LWFTYLSAAYLKRADLNRLPPPTSANTAGGCYLPQFAKYHLKSFITIDGDTGLPRECFGVDDGLLRGVLAGELIVAKRLPAPFDRGFTNVLFRVEAWETYSHQQLPKKSTLEVFWVPDTNIEMVHRFTIEGRKFETLPPAPVPEPSTLGIAVVADGRLPASNAPIVLEYLATNRFLTPKELTNLPGFREAIYRSVHRRPPVIAHGTRSPGVRSIFMVAVVFLAVAPLLFYIITRLSNAQNKTKG
jgi:hypothetical protein